MWKCVRVLQCIAEIPAVCLVWAFSSVCLPEPPYFWKISAVCPLFPLTPIKCCFRRVGSTANLLLHVQKRCHRATSTHHCTRLRYPSSTSTKHHDNGGLCHISVAPGCAELKHYDSLFWYYVSAKSWFKWWTRAYCPTDNFTEFPLVYLSSSLISVE